MNGWTGDWHIRRSCGLLLHHTLCVLPISQLSCMPTTGPAPAQWAEPQFRKLEWDGGLKTEGPVRAHRSHSHGLGPCSILSIPPLKLVDTLGLERARPDLHLDETNSCSSLDLFINTCLKARRNNQTNHVHY